MAQSTVKSHAGIEERLNPCKQSKPPKNANKPTKHLQLIEMLSQAEGCASTDICKRLEWTADSTRSAISTLRKFGFEVINIKSGHAKPSRYKIVSRPSL